ncbi:isoprenylcysteine carboxylmethyltransferase family protein [Sphingobium aquiterrae]|uniref:methyltransferase family protein n=1 Tax=Sphingobium aquiterrae TaxID=2038656 RepID=UPI003018BBB3
MPLLPLHIWAPSPVAPAVMIVFLSGAALFVTLLIVTRLRRGGSSGGGETRDWTSMLGVAAQGLAIALCSGPLRIAGPFLPRAQAPRLVAVAALMLLTVGLFGWATRAMGRNWAIVARTRADHQLVTGGPFAMMRNPIYVALFAFMLAMAVATGHLQALVIALPLYAIGTAIRVRREEALLRAHFGASYDAYAARVPRFLPGLF